jgi:hypothetical protein
MHVRSSAFFFQVFELPIVLTFPDAAAESCSRLTAIPCTIHISLVSISQFRSCYFSFLPGDGVTTIDIPTLASLGEVARPISSCQVSLSETR